MVPVTAVSAVCETCGARLHEGARFCGVCGSRRDTSADAAEYKQVTVLFADVVHSMHIAAAVDTERLREIMTDLVDRCTAIVHHYGGTVDKFTGDGVMALFGAPTALEDHAFRACLAAMKIQAEINSLTSEVQRRDRLSLRLRVGLNSGRVIAGRIGSESLGYTAVGEQVGLAQRVESVAVRDITLARMRALLSLARGEAGAYYGYRARHRAMAADLGFEGHMAWADATT